MVLNSQGKIDQAVNVLKQATSLDPTLAAAFCDLASVLTNQAERSHMDLKPAVDAVNQALVLQQASYNAHNHKGIVLKKAGMLVDAANSFRRVVTLQPRYYHGYQNLGIVLKGMAKLEQAAESYQMAITIKPDFIEGYTNLAIAQRLAGHTKQAIDSYKAVLDLKPNHHSPTQLILDHLLHSCARARFSMCCSWYCCWRLK